MTITAAREANKRYNTNVAKENQEETKKKMQRLNNLQAICPVTELLEISSSKEMIRTVENIIYSTTLASGRPTRVHKAQKLASDQTGIFDKDKHAGP